MADITDVAPDNVTDKSPESENKSKRTRAPNDKDDVHAEAMDRYEAGWNRDRKNQDLAYEDLNFLAGEGQWDAKSLQARKQEDRPVLIVNKTPQFVRQVTGDIRQLRPAVKVVPVDDAASKDVATKILPGMVRYIEQRSFAKQVYFGAADQQVGAGIGHVEVYTEYAAGTTMEQEICVRQIEDGVAVVWDPDSTHPTRCDANWCFVPVDMSRKVFQKKYPDADTTPIGNREPYHTWFSDDYVRIAAYWRKVPNKRKLAVYPSGAIVDLTHDPDGAKAADAAAGNAAIEERDSYQVERYLVSARDIIEGPEKWLGPDIPVAPFIGEQTKIGREIIRNGVTRGLKDVQRLYNYGISADAEVVALQPKAPYKGTRKNFEEFQDQWETVNSKNWPYLEFTPDPENGGKAPEREPPPVASSGIRELLMTSTADMSAVTGIYPAALGQASNETSGKAIIARQREGDTGTYVYIDNFGVGVQRVGQIIVNLIPYIYDTERTIRIVGEDGKIDVMEVNKEVKDPNGDGIATVVLNDLTVGTYEVAVEMGPSYSTKREEARDGMATFMQATGPEVAQLYIDLFAKMQDWPLADKIAKRAQTLLPPHIQQLEAKESGEPPPEIPQAPPTPEQQQALAEQQKANVLEEQRQALDLKKLDVEFRKIEADLAKIEADKEKARLDHDAAMAGHACTLVGQKNGQAAHDPRVDPLIDAVAQLKDVVAELATAINSGAPGASPPAPAVPDGGGGMPPVDLSQLPGAAPPGAPPPPPIPMQ